MLRTQFVEEKDNALVSNLKFLVHLVQRFHSLTVIDLKLNIEQFFFNHPFHSRTMQHHRADVNSNTTQNLSEFFSMFSKKKIKNKLDYKLSYSTTLKFAFVMNLSSSRILSRGNKLGNFRIKSYEAL